MVSETNRQIKSSSCLTVNIKIFPETTIYSVNDCIKNHQFLSSSSPHNCPGHSLECSGSEARGIFDRVEGNNR